VTKFERKVLVKILQENRELKKQVDDIQEALQLLIDIKTEELNSEKK